jgi:hypothetical protein
MYIPIWTLVAPVISSAGKFLPRHLPNMSRDSSVGIPTGYELDDREVGVRVPGSVKNFLFSTSSRPALGSAQPPTNGYWGALYPGVKRPGREADHSPQTSAEVKKTWIYTSTPPYVFIA